MPVLSIELYFGRSFFQATFELPYVLSSVVCSFSSYFSLSSFFLCMVFVLLVSNILPVCLEGSYCLLGFSVPKFINFLVTHF